MKILSAISNSFIKMSVKQKITVGICSVVVIGGGILGIYQIIPTNSGLNHAAETDGKTVNVQTISDEAQSVADKLKNTPAEVQPAETPKAEVQQDSNVLSNAATVEVTTTANDVYIADDGAHYESEPVYTEPDYEAPAATTPVATTGGGWDGDLGASNGSLTDDWQDYGTGTSN